MQAPAFTPQDLTVLDNPIRAKFVSLICNAAYSASDEDGASTFIEKCLELCGGSKELLSQVFQTRFMEKRIPLFLVLCHTRRLAGSETTIPPLITHLLHHLELSGSALDDMELACCVHEHIRLYQLIRRGYLQCSDTITFGSWQGDRYECSIKIPEFIDKMVISQKIRAPFMARWTIFDLIFSATPGDKWVVRLEIKAAHPWKQLERPGALELNIHKVRLYGKS
ncbi:hypothetical protein EST38_g6069 [Candolleomyces aberdarensis]|uniref:Uncharacterized protein n=1 Tax=Candolleomyces aberdarensis TaxID=2316362 RepID=A0A4Q2DIG3_9AGAR|nr:hypothetical protein EST38_g6069 [Candolleomyces aberdarensis]